MEAYPVHMARNLEHCLDNLEILGLPTFNESGGWCNATWDSVLCWPATQPNVTATLPCPPLKGLDPSKNVTKFCHQSGRWAGKEPGDFSRPEGWTDYTSCMVESVIETMNGNMVEVITSAGKIGNIINTVGLVLSFVTLLIAIVLFIVCRRLRTFRNALRLHIMISCLLVIIIRLLIIADLMLMENTVMWNEYSINNRAIICEILYFILEYFKCLMVFWLFIEAVVTIFTENGRLLPLTLIAYVLPLINVGAWLGVFMYLNKHIEKCFGAYYIDKSFLVLKGPEILELVVAIVCLLVKGIIVVILTSTQRSKRKKFQSFKQKFAGSLAVLMWCCLCAILESIPVVPTRKNVPFFVIHMGISYVICSLVGFIMALAYCFLNCEVISALRNKEDDDRRFPEVAPLVSMKGYNRNEF